MSSWRPTIGCRSFYRTRYQQLTCGARLAASAAEVAQWFGLCRLVFAVVSRGRDQQRVAHTYASESLVQVHDCVQLDHVTGGCRGVPVVVRLGVTSGGGIRTLAVADDGHRRPKDLTSNAFSSERAGPCTADRLWLLTGMDACLPAEVATATCLSAPCLRRAANGGTAFNR
mgnify:CR=1 FL=1